MDVLQQVWPPGYRNLRKTCSVELPFAQLKRGYWLIGMGWQRCWLYRRAEYQLIQMPSMTQSVTWWIWRGTTIAQRSELRSCREREADERPVRPIMRK